MLIIFMTKVPKLHLIYQTHMCVRANASFLKIGQDVYPILINFYLYNFFFLMSSIWSSVSSQFKKPLAAVCS